MEPHEIRPDTQLCTILGLAGQNSLERRVFNKILKSDAINATAIALNVKEEHFDFTFTNIARSKIDKVILLDEFKERALAFCDELHNGDAMIDYLEIKNGKISAYSLEHELESLFDAKDMCERETITAAKMLILANRWYGASVDINRIPILLGEER